MTKPLFRDDAYLKETPAQVVAIHERGGIILDQTVFYAQSGGQPGDTGEIVLADGQSIKVAATVYDTDRSTIIHVPADNQPVARVGDSVVAKLNWPARHLRMRVHTALHLLTVALPYPVTGGAIGDGDGRLDFDIPDAGLDKDEIAKKLNAAIATDAPVTFRWITDEELQANPGLVKTMSVKPPMGSGRIRLVDIAGLDLQPCGGTHVRSTKEIGTLTVTNIEKKGKQNRRVRIAISG